MITTSSIIMASITMVACIITYFKGKHDGEQHAIRFTIEHLIDLGLLSVDDN